MVIEKGIVYNCRGKVLHVCTLMLGLYMEESSPYHTGNHESDFATARQLLYNNNYYNYGLGYSHGYSCGLPN